MKQRSLLKQGDIPRRNPPIIPCRKRPHAQNVHPIDPIETLRNLHQIRPRIRVLPELQILKLRALWLCIGDVDAGGEETGVAVEEGEADDGDDGDGEVEAEGEAGFEGVGEGDCAVCVVVEEGEVPFEGCGVVA